MFQNVLKSLLSLSLMLFFASCSSQKYEPLKISASTWIGYTPLFYAKEKGLLKKLNINLVNAATLNENVYLYKAKSVDAFVGTQYEYKFAKEYDSSVSPIMLLDESYGGDMILSNTSIENIKKSNKKIDAYLEMDSVNFTILESFLQYNNIDVKKINYINQDPMSTQSMQMKDFNPKSLVVTYSPFDVAFTKKGFKVIASTKDEKSIVVVDALYTSKKVLSEHYEQLKQLKKILNQSIEALNKDPKAYYEVIKLYMLGVSYEEFSSSLEKVKWINQKLPSTVQSSLYKNSFPLDTLL